LGELIDIIMAEVPGMDFFAGPVVIFFKDIDIIIHGLSLPSIFKVYLKHLQKATIFSSIPGTFCFY
jgi:hypothetical protein